MYMVDRSLKYRHSYEIKNTGILYRFIHYIGKRQNSVDHLHSCTLGPGYVLLNPI